jgi:predicted TIM-barrel fold metal-dependent hydrolase
MRREWLGQITEEILDPDLPIVDPHHHLWPYPLGAFGQYDLSQLRLDAGSGHNVVATVFVECGAAYRKDGPEHLRVVGETEWLAEVAVQSATDGAGAAIRGIVSSADLRLGDQVDEILIAHEAAGHGLFRGIRQRTNHDPLVSEEHDAKPGIMGDPRFIDGVRRLAAGGYTFDAWSFHCQIPELIDVARAVPEITIVSNHLAGPVGVGPYAVDRRASMDEWRRLISELATCPNVVLKLGGLGMHLFGVPWDERPAPPTSTEVVDTWRDDIRWCIDVFGPQRCMFESNFPVDGLGMGYAVLWNAFKLMTADQSPADKAALFSDTARRVYRLDLGA